MRNRGTKSLRILLGCPIDSDPANLPECGDSPGHLRTQGASRTPLMSSFNELICSLTYPNCLGHLIACLKPSRALRFYTLLAFHYNLYVGRADGNG